MSNRRYRKHREKVFLNVYDLDNSNAYTHHMGLGTYHSGVEVYGLEITFGAGGVVLHDPRKIESQIPNQQGAICKFRQQILLGETSYSSLADVKYQLINDILEQKMGFIGANYHLVCKNCNHFANALAVLLLNSTKRNVIPGWVNRYASFGSWIYWTPSRPNCSNDATPFIQKQLIFQGKGKKLNSSFSYFKSLPTSSCSIPSNTPSPPPPPSSLSLTSFDSKSSNPKPSDPKPSDPKPEEKAIVITHTCDTLDQRRQKMLNATMKRLGFNEVCSENDPS